MGPGDTIDRYQLVRRLGRGGQGEVWEALLVGAMGFRRSVALKLIPGRARPGLLHEARLGALVSHPNLVSTFDCGSTDGTTWVAMALVRGPTLAGLLARGPLAPELVVDAGLQVARALGHLHALPVDDGAVTLLHLDVKPSNLLVDASGTVKLVDLGVGQLSGEGSSGGGTLGYCPPEQAAGRAEARSDLFALGATLYALATGQRPFGSGPDRAARVAAVEAHVARMAAEASRAVPGLGDVVTGCLRRLPADRFESARALSDALLLVRKGLGDARVRWGPLVPSEEVPDESEVSAGSVDDLVGRQDELGALLARIVEPGALTLVAPGGFGKTRLAQALVDRAGQVDRLGVFVDLVGATTLAEAERLTALALGLGGSDPGRLLDAALPSQPRTLVVLDNAEQVPALGPRVERWAATAPRLFFLVTSRVPLGFPGEEAMSVGPLSADAARALFEARRGTGGPAPDLSALDGIPLAIELAARSFGDSTFDGRSNPRHGSLAAVLRGSYALLAPPHREALADLATFVGSFSLEAACAVLRRDARTTPVERVHGLLEAGFLQPAGDRFRMLVPIREFAAEQRSDEERIAAERRHGAWFAQALEADRLLLAHGAGPREDHADVLVAVERASGRLRSGTGTASDRQILGATAAIAGNDLFYEGSLADATRLVEEGIAHGDDRFGPVNRVLAAALHLDRLDLVRARSLLAGVSPSDRLLVRLRANFLSAVLAAREERLDEAASRLAECLSEYAAAGHHRECVFCAVIGATHVANAGRRAQAQALLAGASLDDPSLTLSDRCRLVAHAFELRLEWGDRSALDAFRSAGRHWQAISLRSGAVLMTGLAAAELDVGQLALADEALTIGEQLSERAGMGIQRQYAGISRVRLLAYRGALEASLDLAERLRGGVGAGSDGPTAMLWVNTAATEALAGRFDRALAAMAQARRAELGARYQCITEGVLGRVLIRAGSLGEGEVRLARAVADGERFGLPRLVAAFRVAQAEAALSRGRLADLRALLRASEAFVPALTLEMEGEWRSLRVRWCAATGRWDEGAEELERLTRALGDRVTFPRSQAWASHQAAVAAMAARP